jgi:hypothetical protein
MRAATLVAIVVAASLAAVVAILSAGAVMGVSHPASAQQRTIGTVEERARAQERYPNCLLLELARWRAAVPPDRVAVYDYDGAWLGDLVFEDACQTIGSITRIYIPTLGKQWGRICAGSPRYNDIYINGTQCRITEVVQGNYGLRPKGPTPEERLPEDRLSGEILTEP